ncbi:MAG: type II CAAX prenyl endopeptidase Rce1 family protein [Pilosibacter sp.]
MKIRIRRILFPILFCLAVACLIELPLAQTMLFGDDVILWDTLFRRSWRFRCWYIFIERIRCSGKRTLERKNRGSSIFGGAGISLAFGFAVKTLQIPGAVLADESLFTGNLWLEAVVLLAASPVLEEYFFRGVLYGRCKELVSAPAAAFMTAAFFGVFHWDLVQGIYSFFMGLIRHILWKRRTR